MVEIVLPHQLDMAWAGKSPSRLPKSKMWKSLYCAPSIPAHYTKPGQMYDNYHICTIVLPSTRSIKSNVV